MTYPGQALVLLQGGGIMRQLLFIAVIAFLIAPVSLFAQSIGDEIVVVSFWTPIKAGTEEIGKVTAGDIFKVEGINNGTWFLVTTANKQRGWIHGRDVSILAEAPPKITARMRTRPADNDAPDWVYDAVMSLGRARVWHQLGELELAAVDCSVAIQVLSHELESNELAADARNASKILAVCYAQRAICWLILKRKDAAVADLEHAYRLDPANEFAKSVEQKLGDFGIR